MKFKTEPYNAESEDVEMLRDWLVEESGGVYGLSDSINRNLAIIDYEIDQLQLQLEGYIEQT